jgi:feruloyl-CoA synthase
MTPPDGAAPGVSAAAPPPFKPLPMRGPDVDIERRADGSVVIRSNHAPGVGPRSIARIRTGRICASASPATAPGAP